MRAKHVKFKTTPKYLKRCVGKSLTRAAAFLAVVSMAMSMSVSAFAAEYWIGDGDITVEVDKNGNHHVTQVDKDGNKKYDNVLDTDGNVTIKGGSSQASNKTLTQADDTREDDGLEDFSFGVDAEEEVDDNAAGDVTEETNTEESPEETTDEAEETSDEENEPEQSEEENAEEPAKNTEQEEQAADEENAEVEERLVETAAAAERNDAAEPQADAPDKDDFFGYVIKIISNAVAKVTLDNVKIDVSNQDKAAMTIEGDGDVELELDGDNVLKSGGYLDDEIIIHSDTLSGNSWRDIMSLPEGTVVEIKNNGGKISAHSGIESTSAGSLTIKDDGKDGSLEAVGFSKHTENRGYIMNSKGEITSDLGTITGMLTTVGASGIDAGNVKITGGDVTAQGHYGIGGKYCEWTKPGYPGDDGSFKWKWADTVKLWTGARDVEITDGVLRANGTVSGIKGDTIAISGGTVKAVGSGGPAISSGDAKNPGTVSITGDAKVEVEVEENYYGDSVTIGSSPYYENGNRMPGEEAELDKSLFTTGYVHHIVKDRTTGEILREWWTPRKPGEPDPKPNPDPTPTPDPGKPTPDNPDAPKPNPDTSAEDDVTAEVYAVTLPLHVDDLFGNTLAYATTRDGATLTVTVGDAFARLHGTLSALEELRAQGVETIVFATAMQTTTASVADLLTQNSPDTEFAVEHDGLIGRVLVGGDAVALACQQR